MSSPQANATWTFSALTWASFNDFTLVLIEIPAPFKKLSTCNVCFFLKFHFRNRSLFHHIIFHLSCLLLYFQMIYHLHLNLYYFYQTKLLFNRSYLLFILPSIILSLAFIIKPPIIDPSTA